MVRKVYKAKTLVPGFKVDTKLSGKDLIAVPLNKLITNDLYVTFQSRTMKIPITKDPLKTMDFPDKFGRGVYTLAYFEWQPGLEFGV